MVVPIGRVVVGMVVVGMMMLMAAACLMLVMVVMMMMFHNIPFYIYDIKLLFLISAAKVVHIFCNLVAMLRASIF